MNTVQPRIYVACLASYNNGRLHGDFIDATTEVDDMQEEIATMLAASPFPNTMVDCPACKGDGCTACKDTGEIASAEEWAIHDHEGLGSVGENDSLDAIALRVGVIDLAETIGVPAEVCLAVMSDFSWKTLDDAESHLQDAYCGQAETWADYAEDFHRDTGSEIPDWLEGHIDWESFGRDLELGGELSAYDHAGTMYLFNNQA
jgi:antirestriction protein